MTAPLDLSMWRVWAYRAVWTQANVAGGAIVVDFTSNPGQTWIVLHADGVNSGTNTLDIQRVDEDNNVAASFVDVASAAASSGRVPSSFTANTASGRAMGGDWMQLIFAGAQEKFTVRQEGAGAQNDTLTINIRALLRHGQLPLRDASRSTNAANVTETAPTINRMVT